MCNDIVFVVNFCLSIICNIHVVEDIDLFLVQFGFFPYVALDYLGLKSPWQAILLAMFFIVVLLMAMTDFGLKLLLKV